VFTQRPSRWQAFARRHHGSALVVSEGRKHALPKVADFRLGASSAISRAVIGPGASRSASRASLYTVPRRNQGLGLRRLTAIDWRVKQGSSIFMAASTCSIASVRRLASWVLAMSLPANSP
jgi:hypothetical protein